MKAKSAKARPQPRADSIRNRERLLVAATTVFSSDSRQASLEAVAREAGVGIGTLYRHFPTREALFEAVYRHEVDQLFALAEKLSRGADPTEGLRNWLHANIRLVATKKGMVEALQLVAHGSSELKTYSFDRLTTAIAMFLDRGVAAGDFRSDIAPEELLRALVGIFYSQSAEKWQPGALRLVDVFVDGLCKSTSREAPRRR
ncbi:MAG: TetR/AcrR family transcriptional regulator [Alphaproteobacteria bacterium]|jgi:AcrR family transcriptional regulator|nr:MAG: TetR/AcrR family transcriptional regulator [Alphaproteobacteria bacterium]